MNTLELSSAVQSHQIDFTLTMCTPPKLSSGVCFYENGCGFQEMGAVNPLLDLSLYVNIHSNNYDTLRSRCGSASSTRCHSRCSPFCGGVSQVKKFKHTARNVSFIKFSPPSSSQPQWRSHARACGAHGVYQLAHVQMPYCFIISD